ncbi:MAG: GntR family transcriptional regulator [Capsulimonadaceae bacterium]|nr:GntR family transcriptional regulator [Capsulimonadaceae bacterium]
MPIGTVTNLRRRTTIADNVAADLRKRISERHYAPGAPLPARRILAQDYNVAIDTIQHAVGKLVAEGYLRAENGRGTFVSTPAIKTVDETLEVLNVILPSFEGSIGRELAHHAETEAAKAGWQCRVIRVDENDNSIAVRALGGNGRSLVWLWDAELEHLLKHIIEASDRVVVIGNRLEKFGVPSVVADDVQAVVQATSYLAAAGHRKIALVANNPQERMRQVQIASWRSCVEALDDPAAVEKRLISAQSPHAHCMARSAYQAVRTFLESEQNDITALISVDDHIAMGTMAACRDAGYDVPDQLSLINCGDSDMMEFGSPPVTAIDVNLHRHVEIAMQLLSRPVSGDPPGDTRLRFVQPRLIERKSVAPATRK